jgi:hypothetical protein
LCAQASDGAVGTAMTGVGTEELTQGYSGRRRESRQGSMSSRRMITPTIVCLVALSAVMAAPAQASSLLSGYGGPGQGSQAILGSSLINGGSGGSSGGGQASTAGTPGATGTGQASGAPGSAASKHAVRSGRAGRHAGARVGGASGNGAQVTPASSGALTREAGASQPLGLSSRYVVYILLGLVALIFIGVLTRRMARPTATGRHGG